MKIKFLSLFAGLTFLTSPMLYGGTKLDNSKINQRDRTHKELTADDQSNDPRDIEITRKIRQKLMEDERISTYGKNVKVITRKGEITLKGPVKTKLEKALIETHATKVAGFKHVNSELSIKKTKRRL
jgi:osmotically-inducible protein OsmY